jgi:hypothetical protein
MLENVKKRLEEEGLTVSPVEYGESGESALYFGVGPLLRIVIVCKPGEKYISGYVDVSIGVCPVKTVTDAMILRVTKRSARLAVGKYLVSSDMLVYSVSFFARTEHEDFAQQVVENLHAAAALVVVDLEEMAQLVEFTIPEETLKFYRPSEEDQAKMAEKYKENYGEYTQGYTPQK